MYSYIGVLVNDSGTFDVADVLVNPIFCEQYMVPRENQTILKVKNALAGIYNAYHVLNEDYEVSELLVLHHTYSLQNIDDFPSFCVGAVCTALSQSVCVVDERYHFDPSYSYFKLESEALYDGDEILKLLPSSPYPANIKSNLFNVVTTLRAAGKHPTGKDIYEATIGHNVWEVFCSNKIYSSHWSVDTYNRLKSSYIPAAVFKGGVVSKSEPGFLVCYCYRNSRAMAYAIRIPLVQYELLEEDNKGADIIKFPTITDNVVSKNYSGENS